MTHGHKGEEHQDAAKDELIGAFGVGLVDVVHVTSACNDLHSSTVEIICPLGVRWQQLSNA